jgi:glycosyltransferase involved in cell wall biosynthesis
VIVPSTGHRIRWTFLVPGILRPSGGNFVMFEYANAIARRESEHVVRVVHPPTDEGPLRDVSHISWFAFDPAIEHVFPSDLDPDALPDADVIVYTIMVVALGAASAAGPVGRRLIEQLQAPSSRAGLPMLLVQALGIFPDSIEELALRGSGPKICVASWIADALVDGGLPSSDVVHIPNGINHRKFRVTRPIRERDLQVAMNFNSHPLKHIDAGIDALRHLHRDYGVPSILFGARPPGEPLGPGLRFALAPHQTVVAESIYNNSTIYLQPSLTEGFGMCAVEAMACGCALVTTANGGSADYAFDGETALVCGPDAEQLAEAVVRLVTDDDLRVRIAENGHRSVERFRWEASAERLARVAVDTLKSVTRANSGSPWPP